jgi:hypothetical protein
VLAGRARRFVLALVVALVVALVIVAGGRSIGWADPAPRDVTLPPGTRTDSQGQLVSGRGLRDTTDFIARDLDRRGIAVQRIGPYAVRGVELTRFLSQAPATTWLAIHVVRSAGKTLIFFVPRAKSSMTP